MEKIKDTMEKSNPNTRATKIKREPILQFYGNHSIDFGYDDINTHENYAISALRQIPIPDEILLAEYDALMKYMRGCDISKLVEIDNWVPVKFPPRPGVMSFQKENIVTFGPMGMHLVITPQHIKLPGILYEKAEWYSPLNKETVQILRTYYHTIINQFGGDHALYVNERIVDKYYNDEDLMDSSTLAAFKQNLLDRYGPIKKPMHGFTPSKLPKYYLDPVTPQQ
jgi:hypothetical protein